MAIHIPKVIVHADGTIDKEKYIALVRDFYKETILLDEHGEIKEFYFKLRLFKNDLVYDTEHHVIQKFNIGSVAKRSLELKHIYQFSYDEIYEQVWFMRKALCIHFDMKLRHINPSGKTQFKDLPIQKVVEFCLDNLMDIDDKERYKKAIVKMLEQETSMQSFLEKAAFIQLVVNRPCTPPTIFGQYCPTATAVNGDEQYIKIKSTILGIRWQYNEKGNLMISGPNGAIHKYSKIRKEPFSWKICKSVIE